MAPFEKFSSVGYGVVGPVLPHLTKADLVSLRQASRSTQAFWPKSSKLLGTEREPPGPLRLCHESSLPKCKGPQYGSAYYWPQKSCNGLHLWLHDENVRRVLKDVAIRGSVVPSCRDSPQGARDREDKHREGCHNLSEGIINDEVCEACQYDLHPKPDRRAWYCRRLLARLPRPGDLPRSYLLGMGPRPNKTP